MFIWAGSFIFIKIGLRELDPYNLAFYRFLIASPLIFIWIFLKEKFAPLGLSDLFHVSSLHFLEYLCFTSFSFWL